MLFSELIVPLAWGVGGAACLMNLLLYLLMGRKGKIDRKVPLFSEAELPTVSVLVAARNESASLRRCISSLLLQEYPHQRLEILLGNDHSTDNTLDIMHEFAALDDRLAVYNITQNAGMARGKANVLAQLAQRAGGQVLLITDADMWLPPTWCRSLVDGFGETTGIVTGYTAVEAGGLWAWWQAIDWALALGMIKVITDSGRPVTAMGNNMAVLAGAYRATGGYENMPFSITEDYQLTRAVVAKGYSVRQLATPAATGLTLPIPTWAGLLHQRKRWTQGALQLPASIIIWLGLQAAYYPIVMLGSILSPAVIIVAVAKGVAQALFCHKISQLSGRRIKIAPQLAYEFYGAIISLSTLLFAALPLRVHWKGRHY